MKRVQLTVNGLQKDVVVDEAMVLLDLLRDDLQLTGTKQSCDKKGQCGACTVLVDGKALRSCSVKVARLQGADVVTIEGLGTPDNPHLIQEAFVLAGAVQCGFCTPGMVMAAQALLDRNPDPSPGEIKKALVHNLCRCTGYVKIIEAVQLAGRFLRGETTPDAVRPDPTGPKIGVSHPRPSGMLKACGLAAFGADIVVPGALNLAVVRSPHAHAAITAIDASAAEAMPGVAGVMTATDIKGSNRLQLAPIGDRPVLCEDKVRVIGDPVVIVAADTRERALAAAEAVVVEYELLPVLQSPQQAMADGAVRLHEQWPNLCLTQAQVKGDAAAALADSAATIEARFTTQINHQAPLEPEAAVAFLEGEGEDAQLVVVGRSINIHKALAMLQDALGWENTRYEEAYTGGQFGIKVEITSEGIAGAAALHFRRPVRYIPGLTDTLLLTPKRHPFDLSVALGADTEGHLTGYTMDVTVDNGAYFSSGQVVVYRSVLMLSGSYNIPNVDALLRLVYTNNPWGAAARGAGPPQMNFALECAMEMLARTMGIDPLDFRVRNSLQPGQTKSTGQVVEEWPLPGLFDAIRPEYQRSRREAESHRTGNVRRGVGLGAGSFGIGAPGDQSMVAVELDLDGGVTIYAAVADPGEGNDSMLTQLAADAMGLPLDMIRLVTRDTDHTTANGPAAASRMTYMAGGALLNALDSLKQAMSEAAARTRQELLDAGLKARHTGTKKTREAGPLDENGQGPSFESQVHAVQLAEVEVDVETGDVRVVRMTTAVDAGTVLNPQNLTGQLEGGADMGVGYALREQYIAGQTKDWVTFGYPSMRTAFDMNVIVRETPRKYGTRGAVGVGEMTMVPTAPAVINAIYDAVGVWICDLPATPGKVKAALAATPE
jgi:aldehyde oxidoreductase